MTKQVRLMAQKMFKYRKLITAIQIYIKVHNIKSKEQVKLVKANLQAQLKLMQGTIPTSEWDEQLQMRCLLDIAKYRQQTALKFDMSNFEETFDRLINHLKKTIDYDDHVRELLDAGYPASELSILLETQLIQSFGTIKKVFHKVSELETRLKAVVAPKEQIHLDVSEFLDITLNPSDFVSYKEIVSEALKSGISPDTVNKQLTSLINRVNNPNMRRHTSAKIRGFIGLKLKKVQQCATRI